MLERAGAILGGVALPEFPSWFRVKGGYTSMCVREVDLLGEKEVKARMKELERYLNELAVNKVATSTAYFAKFLGLSIKVGLRYRK